MLRSLVISKEIVSEVINRGQYVFYPKYHEKRNQKLRQEKVNVAVSSSNVISEVSQVHFRLIL